MNKQTNKQKNQQRSMEWSEVTQSCPTLCNSMDCSLPGSSIRGIFQARVLEWVAISVSRESFPPRDRTRVSRFVGRRFAIWTTMEVWVTVKQYNIHVIGVRSQGQGLLFSPLDPQTLTQIFTQQRPGGKLSPFFFLCYLRTLTYVAWKNNPSVQKGIERALFL